MDHSAEVDIIRTVSEAAEQGVKFVAPGRRDVIEDVISAVTLRWKMRATQGNPPINPRGWAFICAKHLAVRILKTGDRYIELSEAIADSLSEPAEETLLIEKIQPAPIGWLKSGEAIEALKALVEITTRIIGQKADETDHRIWEMHYKRHWTFSKIATEIGITDDCARKRWSRLMWAATEDIIEIVRKDRHLATIFSAILEDSDDFRSSLLNLLSLISTKGFAAIETTIDSIFSA